MVLLGSGTGSDWTDLGQTAKLECWIVCLSERSESSSGWIITGIPSRKRRKLPKIRTWTPRIWNSESKKLSIKVGNIFNKSKCLEVGQLCKKFILMSETLA